MGLFSRRDRTPAVRAEIVEQRDPRAATRALRYVTPGRAQPPDWDATQAFQRAYYANIVVYACTRLAANTIGSLPFRVGADPDKPNDYDPASPLAQLLGPPPGGPAPKLTARRLWAWTVAQRIVTGRNGWEIEPNDAGYPSALWPLASSALVPIPTTEGAEWWSGFQYGRPDQPRQLPTELVVYDWDPSGTDFRQAESAIEAAHLDVNVAVMQSMYDYRFLKNDARPPAIVVTEEFEDAAAFEAFKRQWDSEHRGPENAGRMAFVEATSAGDQGVKGAVDVTVLGISPKDAQAAQRHAVAMERIAIALGTPWSLLDASGRTFDNASQEWRTYVKLRIASLCADLADMVNLQLAPLFGDSKVGWFDLSSLGMTERPVPVTQAATAPAMVQAQLITINEARADYGLPAIDGGDRMMTTDEIDALRGSGASLPPVARAAVADGETRAAVAVPGAAASYVGPAATTSATSTVRVVTPERRAPTAAEIEERRRRIWVASDATVRNLEAIWERAWRRIFARQERSTIAQLEAKRGRQAVARADTRALGDEVFDPAHWMTQTEDDVKALYEAVTAAGGARVSQLFGIAFDLEAPYARAFVDSRANQLAGQVTDTTYRAITSTLSEGVGAGEAIPDLAARIRTVFAAASERRAITIARTEVISAFNGSAAAVASQLPGDVVGGQEWIATRDSRTRESHAELDGTVVGMEEVFPNGLAYPGDPSGDAAEVVNCRCTQAFLTPEEYQSVTGEQTTGRMIDRRTAVAVLGMVTPGAQLDERALRAALVAA